MCRQTSSSVSPLVPMLLRGNAENRPAGSPPATLSESHNFVAFNRVCHSRESGNPLVKYNIVPLMLGLAAIIELLNSLPEQAQPVCPEA